MSAQYGADVQRERVAGGASRRHTDVLRFGPAASTVRKQSNVVSFYGPNDGLDERMPSAESFVKPTESSLSVQRNSQGKLPPKAPPRRRSNEPPPPPPLEEEDEEEEEEEEEERREEERRESRRRSRHRSRKHGPETAESEEESEEEQRRRKRAARKSKHRSHRHKSKSQSRSHRHKSRSSNKGDDRTDDEDDESVSVSSLGSKRIREYGNRDLSRVRSGHRAEAHSSIGTNGLPRFNSDTPVGRSWDRVQKVMAKRASQQSQQSSTLAAYPDV